MRIGIVCYPTFGGSGVIATELGKALADKGHEVHFITYSQPVRLDVFAENIYYHEVGISDYPLFKYTPYELALSSKMVDVVKFHKLDLLHVHYAIPHAYAAYMARQILMTESIHIPVVTTLHGTDITLVGKHPSYRPAVTFSINQSSKVTTVSQSLKEDTLRFFDITRDIEVIPNFIDFNFYNYNTADKEGCLVKPGEKLITHISNFRPVKRTLDVIDIYAGIHENVSSCLLMIGDGPDREQAESKVRQLGLSQKVKFIGKSNEVERILSLADLFILPSETESFGLAALEAMAARTPVISTNTGGLPEVNIHGETGFLSDVGAVEDMTRHALHILSDEEHLKMFKNKAYNRAREFDIKDVLPQYEALYEAALEEEQQVH